jgi:hypothetical protein
MPKKWEAEPKRTAEGFDIGYYEKLLEKAWEETAFVFWTRIRHRLVGGMNSN